MRTPTTAFLLAAAIAGAAPAQDMLAVGWSGSIYTLDSQTGETGLAGPGLFGMNCMARDGAGRLWTVSRTFLGSPVYYLTELQPATLQLTAVAPCQDVRAMADAGNGEIYAIEFAPGDYRLSRLDTTTGARTFVGATGHEIQALTNLQGTLYAWSLSDGLGTLDPTTGAFTDLGPAPGGGAVQFLAVRPDGELIGGGYDLFTIDAQTGQTTWIATQSAYLRGAEATGFGLRYGDGCYGVELGVTGPMTPGSVITSRSTGYPNTNAVVGIAGVCILGTSRTTWQNAILPIDLDPLLGTSGCALYTSIDATETSFTTGVGAPSLFVPIAVPAAVANQTFYVQHAAFDFNANFYWSNGVQLHIGL